MSQGRIIRLGYGYRVSRDRVLDHVYQHEDTSKRTSEKIEEYMEARGLYFGIIQTMTDFDCVIGFEKKTQQEPILLNDDDRCLCSTFINEIDVDSLKLDELETSKLKDYAALFGADITEEPKLILSCHEK